MSELERIADKLSEGMTVGPEGLIVPQASVNKNRVVWTDDQVRLMERATGILAATGWMIRMVCPEDSCAADPIAHVREVPGGVMYFCNHQEVFRMRGMQRKPSALGPTATLCNEKDERTVERCDRVKGHAGRHTWQSYRRITELEKDIADRQAHDDDMELERKETE